MYLAGGPQVVGRQDEQEDIAEQRRHDGISVDNGEGPTSDSSDRQSTRGHDDEGLCAAGLKRLRNAKKIRVENTN